MIKNNNAGIVRKISFRSLKSGKMRNIMTVAAIALAAALISGLSGFTSGIEKEEERQLASMQHVIYMDVSEKQIEALRKDGRTEDLLTGKQGNIFECDGYTIRAGYFSNEEHIIKTAVSEIREGHYPEKINEIAVDKAYMAYIGKEPVIGAEVEITWLNGVTENYVVTGYTDYKNQTNFFTILFSEEYAREGSQLKDIPFLAAVRVYDADKMGRDEFLNTTRNMGEQTGVPRYNININKRYVTNKTRTSGELLMVIGISALILFASVLVIYSIFYISISGRVRQFGQLRTIGMTSGQIKKAVNIEGILLGIIGIIIGLAVGTLFAFCIKPAGFYFPNTIAIWFVTTATVLLAVMLSIRKPAKLASSVSPVEAAGSSGYEETGRKTRHIKKQYIKKRYIKNQHIKNQYINNQYRKLTPFGLAKISSDRNRKKSRMTAFSLGVGGIIFICGATLLASFNREEYSRQLEFYFGEYMLSVSSNAKQLAEHGITDIQLSGVLNDELKAEIASLTGVEHITAGEILDVTYEYNNYRADDSATPFDREDLKILNRHSEESVVFDYDKMVSEKEVIITDNDTAEEIFGWRFQTGDKVLLRWFDGKVYQEDYFTIAGCIDRMGMYNDKIDTDSSRRLFMGYGWFLIPRELAENMVLGRFDFYDKFIISVSDWQNDDTVKEYLEKIADENLTLSFETLEQEMKNDEISYLTLQYMIYGISAFTIAFALLNLINTLVSNAVARRREFAVLCSIGMSNKQLSEMIIGEGVILAVKNIIITLAAGTAAGYILICLAGKAGINYLHWHFPLWYLIGYSMFVIIIPVIISWVIIKILEQKSLVERLCEAG